MIGGRYRIVSLLGRGGMGEVYRADDLTLSVAVALKFLPAAIGSDPDVLERFRGEMRIARQISHPNICRVFDVGEVDGQHFFSMEYILGEDLASLLRRIGRLPPERALRMARQLCAGLAAAHDLGHLHRDLKPANVMIDEEGRARITDFGLAAVADTVAGGEVRSGTPAYMAPEQAAGEEVTARSDLYSMGLVLYEIFTGHRAFDSDGHDRDSRSTPTRPSDRLEWLDPAVEAVVLRCLEPAPADRPASAAEVAAALPGGDPLAAALAAGQTPSPQMVARGGGVGGLSPAAGWSWLGALLLGLALVLLLLPRAQLFNTLSWPHFPERLAERAREILREVGYRDEPVDFDYGLWREQRAIQWLAEHRAEGDFPGIAALQISFWCRQSPFPIERLNWFGLSSYNINDPPPDLLPGMVRVGLTSDGRLAELLVEPPERDFEAPAGGNFDLAGLLDLAGVDRDSFREVEPTPLPQAFADERRPWEGPWSDPSEPPSRFEAAAHAGRPVSFRSLFPFLERFRMSAEWEGPNRRGVDVFALCFIALTTLALAFAVRNLRAGRADLAGALRLAATIFFLNATAWALGSHHVASPLEVVYLFGGLSAALFFADRPRRLPGDRAAPAPPAPSRPHRLDAPTPGSQQQPSGGKAAAHRLRRRRRHVGAPGGRGAARARSRSANRGLRR